MNSFFLEKFNDFLSFSQNKFSFLSKNSFFIAKIDYIIKSFAFIILGFSLFASSKILGILVIVAFGLLGLKYLMKQGSQITIDIFDMLVIFYVMIFCLATVFSSWFMSSIHGLFKVFIYFFSYLIFKDVIKQNLKNKLYFIIFLAILVSVESVFAIMQQIFGVEMLATWQDMKAIRSDQIMNRVYGTLQPLNPNLLAGYLIASMPAVLGCVFYNFKKVKYNFLALVGVLSTILAIIFTGCRGAYIAFFVQGLLFVAISGHIIWHEFSHKKLFKKIWLFSIILGVVGVLGLIFSSPALQHRISSIFAFRADSSNSFRLNVYASSLKMFIDNWLTGIGVGNWTFREVYGLYMLTGYDALGAYSVPLEIAVETGILGLLNFICLIFLSFIRSVKNILAKILYNRKVLTIVCFLSIVGMMVHGVFDTVWFRPQIQFVFWLMVAILSSIKVQEVKE